MVVSSRNVVSFGKYRFLTILCLVLLAFQTSSQQTTANQLNLPQRNFVGFEMRGDAGNDIIIGSSPEYGVLNEEFLLTGGSSGHILTNAENRVDLISGPSSFPFSIFDHQGINHFVNDSVDDLIFEFQAEFFDLLDLNGEDLNNTNLIEDVLLFNGETYGLMFNVPEDEVMMPLVISTNAHSDVNPVRLQLDIIDPTGAIHNINMNLPPGEDSLFPYVPFESGPHQLFLEPQNGDVVLDHFAVLDNFPVENIENGCIKTLRGTRADVDFFRPLILDDLNQGNTNVGSTDTFGTPPPGDSFFDIRVDGFVHQNQIIQDLNFPNDLLGSAEILVHTPDFPFGASIPQSTLHNDNTIISTTVFPPDDANPSVRSEKERLGIEEGYDIELGFWFEVHSIPELPIGENVLLNNGDTEDWYTFTLADDMIVGLNDSLTSEFGGSVRTFATFTNTQTGDNVFINARDNDLLHFDDVFLALLPAGNYTLEIAAPSDSFAQFNLFDFDPLNPGTSTSVTQDVGDNAFFYLPSDNNFLDSFFLNTTDLVNMTALYEILVYDSAGTRVNGDSYSFDRYGNLVNSTFVNSPGLTHTGGVNPGGGFLQIRHTGNTLWNTSLLSPTELESDIDVSSTLYIQRLQQVEELRFNNPDGDYAECNYNSFSESALNGSRTQIIRYCDYESSPGGNRLLINAVNMSMNVLVFIDGANQWFDVDSTNNTLDGISEYSVIIEFATLESQNYIVVIEFFMDRNGIDFNNSLSLNSEITAINFLPEIVLRNLSFTSVGSSGDVPDVISTSGAGSDPFTIGDTYIATGGITVGAAVVFYAVQIKGFRPNLNRFRRE
ncbi:MAG: hypothetical protein GPJ54_16430 [Candidatus Heimdallarchaeota archaeon]|nr:hypothetical protein [Candidatus Heimdallarchaeota archaeon]